MVPLCALMEDTKVSEHNTAVVKGDGEAGRQGWEVVA